MVTSIVTCLVQDFFYPQYLPPKMVFYRFWFIHMWNHVGMAQNWAKEPGMIHCSWWPMLALGLKLWCTRIAAKFLCRKSLLTEEIGLAHRIFHEWLGHIRTSSGFNTMHLAIGLTPLINQLSIGYSLSQQYQPISSSWPLLSIKFCQPLVITVNN